MTLPGWGREVLLLAIIPVPQTNRRCFKKVHTVNAWDALFCDKPAGKDYLCNASTFDLDKYVRKSALKLQEKPLHVKLSVGNLIAQDAHYHVTCLVSLYNKARATKTTIEDQDYQSRNSSWRTGVLGDISRTWSEIFCLISSRMLDQLCDGEDDNIRYTTLGRRHCVMGCIPHQQAVHSRGTWV